MIRHNLSSHGVRWRSVLADSELVAIWHATDGAGPFNSILRVLLLTGQRRSEVSGMSWSELSDDLSTWTIPASRTKNSTTHVLPLSVPVRAILLRAVPRLGEIRLSRLKW